MITKQMLLDSFIAIQENNHTGTMSVLLDFIKNIPGNPEFDIKDNVVKEKSKGPINRGQYVSRTEAIVMKQKI